MGKPGRKRKAGAREPNGKLQRPTLERLKAMDGELRRREMAVVLAQPHRRGNTSQWAGSVFGRFCLVNGLPLEVYDAGQDYAAIVARWRAARGIPVTNNRTAGPTPVERLDADERRRIDRLRNRMTDADRVLMGQGIEAYIAVRQLLVDEYELSHEQDAHAIMGLQAVSLHLGYSGRRAVG